MMKGSKTSCGIELSWSARSVVERISCDHFAAVALRRRVFGAAIFASTNCRNESYLCAQSPLELFACRSTAHLPSPRLCVQRAKQDKPNMRYAS